MPPKRKVPARRASTSKAASIGGSTIIPASVVSSSSRTRRSTAVNVDYKLTPSRASNGSLKKQAKSFLGVPGSKAPGDPVAETPKRRGRPPKAAVTNHTSPKAAAVPTPAKATRGRPKKADAAPVVAAPTSSKRKRGDEEPQLDPPKKRGRPAKTETVVVEAAAPKKRGRPAKVAVTSAPTRLRKPLLAQTQEEEPESLTPRTKAAAKSKSKSTSKAAAKPAAKRGRPPGSTNKSTTKKPSTTKNPTTATKRGPKSKTPKESIETEAEDFVEGLTQDDEQDADDLQYWLMKAEPNTRIEKGVDVAYPIDKLAQATEPEPWDGKSKQLTLLYQY